MIVLERWVGPLRDHLVFFAAGDEVTELAERCRAHDVFRVRHALGALLVPQARHAGESLTSAIDLTREPDAIYAAMDAKSCRYEIRRAEKLGERLSFGRNDERSVAAFRPLFNGVIAHTHYTRALSRRRYRQYREVSDVLVAYVDGRPVAGHLVVRDPAARRARLVFSASVRFDAGPFQKLSGPVNRWLHWQELLLYRDEGYAAYDFGGVNPASSIGRFKLTFGGGLEPGTNVVLAGPLAAGPLALVDSVAAARSRRARGQAGEGAPRPDRSSASS
jgi:hypothetical protein